MLEWSNREVSVTTPSPSEDRQPTRWWLPDKNPDQEFVGGLYWVSSSGTPCASWHSPLPGGPRSIMSQENPIPILHGDAMGTAITLTDVQIISTQHPARGRVSQTEANARLAFEGDLLLGPEDLEFDRVRVRLRDLSSWADWTSWKDVDADRPSFIDDG